MKVKYFFFPWVLFFFSGQASAAETATLQRYSFAHCAAYFFNSTKVSRVGQYEELYQLGEEAIGFSRRTLTNEETVFRMAEASEEMTNIIERDWRKFEILRDMYDLSCRRLLLDTPKD
ncbi:hypothetical protein OAT13_01945 [Gammaproteobacteria bacterium]|nr:hypothetical protein [Gammaproteobacteria bacterium]